MVKYTNTILRHRVHPKIRVEGSSPDTGPSRKRFRPGKPSADVVTTDLKVEPEKQVISLSAITALSQLQQDFVLESVLAGSTDSIRLIYSTDVPTLAHLVEQVRKKHCLDPKREILKICAKIKGQCLNVDLEDKQDWTNIMRLIMDSKETPELVVWTS